MMSVSLRSDFQSRVLHDEPMSRHTSWHVGGPAEIYFTPRDREDLAVFLRNLPAATPILWVGLGSNLLVRDGGVKGVVIAPHGSFNRLERLDATRVYCEVSVPCTRLARQCAQWGLAQGEFFAGIPGALGGAPAMNAGAYGGETWNHVQAVEVAARDGTIRRRAASEYLPGYRHVRRPADDEWFLAAELQFSRGEPDQVKRVRELSERRKRTQPLGQWSCGSVFTNPPGDHAARLIEAAGLKGSRIGGAVVSEKHANFIINEGAATARDLEQLIMHVRDTVQKVHGITLVPEVKIVGEPA
jgi:UDP-N-acetylmuramate dehydrogenase